MKVVESTSSSGMDRVILQIISIVVVLVLLSASVITTGLLQIARGADDVLDELMIYDDALQNGFAYNEWGEGCLVSLSYEDAAVGTYSLATDLNNYLTLFLYTDTTFARGTYSDVEFYIRGISPVNESFDVRLASNSYTRIGSPLPIGDYVDVSDSWQHVRIPLKDFGVEPDALVAGLVFRDNAGVTGRGYVLLDSIRFVELMDTTAPEITSASAISLDQVTLTFNEKMDPIGVADVNSYSITSTTDINYESGRNPVSSSLLTNEWQALLTVSPELQDGNTYTVSVNGLQDLAGNTIPPDSEVSFDVAIETVTLSVDAEVSIYPFNSMMRGSALVNWMHSWNRPFPGEIEGLVELTKVLNPGIMRYGGGLWVNGVGFDRSNSHRSGDAWTYVDPDTGDEYWYNHCLRADEIDSFVSFCEQVGAEPLIQVNLASSSDGHSNPKMWADLVRYCNVDNDYDVKYWEPGNEWDYAGILDENEYAQRFVTYQDAMLEVDPTIQFMGPVSAGFHTDWFDPLLSATHDAGHDLDVLDWHWYQLLNYSGDSRHNAPENLFKYDDSGEADWLRRYRRVYAEDMMNVVKNDYLPGYPNMFTALTELGTGVGQDAPMQSDFAAALWLADMLGRFSYNGLDICTTWDLYDVTYWGHTYPDDSMYPDDVYVRPIYYTKLMYGQYFGDQMVESSTSDPEKMLTIWASTDVDEPDTLKLMVTNLNENSCYGVINVDGFDLQGGEYYRLTNPDPLSGYSPSFGTVPNQDLMPNVNGYQIEPSHTADTIIASIPPMDISVIGSSFEHYFPAHSVTSIILEGTYDTEDSTPPVISPVQVIDATSSSATITWTTDDMSDSAINYGETESLGTIVSDSSLVTSHTMELTGLSSNTTYYYQVTSTNSDGYSSTSGLYTFTTLESEPEVNRLLVYDESLVNGFSYNEWGEGCLVTTSYADSAYSGSYSLATDLNNYKTLFLYTYDMFDVAEYSDLEFYIRGNTPPNNTFRIKLATSSYGSTGSSLPISDYVTVGEEWQYVKIPVGAFGVAPGTQIAGFRLRDDTGGNDSGYVLLDEIHFSE
ncbi:MAG: Ig-like domain-containing protein [Chloroflexota bacterium]|nr:Ig-like domain-containing protein [Chloroflexota bacterium]